MHIASLMNNKGRIFAFDKSKSKVREMQELLQGNGVSCVSAMYKDSTKLLQMAQSRGLGEDIVDGHPVSYYFSPNSFDCILLDPPCSGIGTYHLTLLLRPNNTF